MALINCSECGKEISDKATTCPHCGAPVEVEESLFTKTFGWKESEEYKRKEKKRKYKWIFLLIIAFIGIVIFIFKVKENREKEYTVKKIMKEYHYIKKDLEEIKSTLTEEEIENDLEEIEKDLLKESDLPLGKTIFLRGKVDEVCVEKYSSYITICDTEDDKYINHIMCFVNEGEDISFLEKGENVLIKGRFSNDSFFLTDCEIISPSVD